MTDPTAPLCCNPRAGRRVVFVLPEYPGIGPSFGIGQSMQVLARGLAAAGASVRILALADSQTVLCTVEGAILGRGPSFRHLAVRALACREWMGRMLAELDPGIIECSNWGGLLAYRTVRCPVVVRLSTSGGWAGIRRPSALLASRQELLTVRRADLVVANSQAMAEQAVALYGVRPQAVIPHAYPAGIRAAGDRPEEVLFVGRPDPRKGFDLLLAAWAVVVGRRPGAILHAVGPGLSALARGVPGVIAYEWLSDEELGRLRARCRVQAVPSRYESFGMVVLEAWAAGMAVVASRVGGLPEVVGEAGILADPESAGGLAAAILAALDPESAARFADRGRERLRSVYGPEVVTRLTLAAYDRLPRRPRAD